MLIILAPNKIGIQVRTKLKSSMSECQKCQHCFRPASAPNNKQLRTGKRAAAGWKRRRPFLFAGVPSCQWGLHSTGGSAPCPFPLSLSSFNQFYSCLALLLLLLLLLFGPHLARHFAIYTHMCLLFASLPRDRKRLFYFLNLGSRSFSSLFAVQAGPDQEHNYRLTHPDDSGQTPRCLAHSNIFYTTPSTRAQCTPPPSHAFSLPNQILSLSQCSEAAQDRGRAHRKSRHWA